MNGFFGDSTGGILPREPRSDMFIAPSSRRCRDDEPPTPWTTAMSARKIYDPVRLLSRLDEARLQGRTIVFANGCFELLHVGHVRYLQAARELGDLLVVAVNTDASLAMVKPGRRPVNSDAERMEILAALDAVDYVIPLADRTPAGLLALLRPHVHTKGTDYTLERIPERVVVESYGGRVELVGGPKERSTTDMLRTIRATGEAGEVPAAVEAMAVLAQAV
jgi:D-beta-D-heptose 7-phosphate kinase/D-beta-D-heptose 1-phosphate adenosyltransferase